MLISMKQVKTEDGSGIYWAPHDAKGVYCPESVEVLDNLGHPPDTGGWVEPAEIEGWYNYESIGALIDTATKAGHAIVFHKVI